MTWIICCLTWLLVSPSGQYAGTWTSDSGANSGKVNVTVAATGEGDLSFTYMDQVVKPNKVTAKVGDSEVEFVCYVDLDGFKLKTAFHGTVDGKTMSGKYQTVSTDDGSAVDSGTWKVTQQ